MVLWAYEMVHWAHERAHLVYEMARLVYEMVRWAPLMDRLVYGRVLRAYGKVLRGHHGVVLHRAVVPIPRWSLSGPAPYRSSGRSWQLHRVAPSHSLGKVALLRYAPWSMRCPFP